MYDHHSNDSEVKESAVAKSTGEQDEKNMLMQDAALFRVLSSGKKISKEEAEYREYRREDRDPDKSVCRKCKFNLGDEKKCHIVEGEISNEYGISKFFCAKGEGMLPGDIVWMFVKKTGRKLRYEEGYVIEKGAEGFQCKDCKYYMYAGKCLLIKGKFRPEMSCGFIVKLGNGTDI
jgi:mannose-6-phosphate isomerase-like protein (cupin superfamily)